MIKKYANSPTIFDIFIFISFTKVYPLQRSISTQGRMEVNAVADINIYLIIFKEIRKSVRLLIRCFYIIY